MAKLINSNATQAPKSKKKGKSKSKGKGKAEVEPKQKSNSPTNNKITEATAPIIENLASEKVQTTTKNDVEADVKNDVEADVKNDVEADVRTINPKDSIKSGIVKEVARKDVEVNAKTIKPMDSIKSIDVHYYIGKHQGGILHEGTRNSRIFSVSRSFIEATLSQITNIRELVEISSSSRYITTVEDLIDDPERLPMLVTEPVVSVTSFFKVEADSFLKNISDGVARSDWWTTSHKKKRGLLFQCYKRINCIFDLICIQFLI